MEGLKDYLIQAAYNYIGNNRLDESTDKLYCEVMDRLEPKLNKEDADFLSGKLVELDHNGFFEGAKAILSLLK